MRPNDKTLRRLGVSFVTEEGGISEYLLKANSLRILLVPDPAARAVVVLQHVHVGSRHEGAGNTGYSHLLEHMLFKGTPSHNAALGNSYDDFMKPLGGVYNATTWLDRTNYYSKVPTASLGELLAHEADRLRNGIIIDADLVTEMPVVVDEFDRGANDPSQVLDKQMTATAFTEHPYKVDTIGAKSEVIRVTAAQLKEKLYDVYYWPNNTTLIVVGGFDVEEALTLIVKNYAHIPSSPRPIPTPYTVEPEQFGERRFVINKTGDLPLIALAFHIPEADHEDTAALAALSVILGGDQSSRLHRKLVDKGLASEAGCQANDFHDPHLFSFSAKLTPGTKLARVEKTILREIASICAKGVTADELKRAKTMNRNGTIHSRANKLAWAMQISESEARGDWKLGTRYDDLFDLVTVEKIVEVAKRYLTADNRTVGYFVPKAEKLATETAPELGGEPTATAATFEVEPYKPWPQSTASGAKPVSLDANYGGEVQKTVLANGLTVLLLPTPTESAIGVSLGIRAGSYQVDPTRKVVGNIVAQILPKGSKRYSKKRITDIASEMLARVQFSATPFETTLGTHVPPADVERFLDLVSDVVRNPLFSAAELELLKTINGAQLKEQDTDPETSALTALSQALYTSDSPHFRANVADRLAALNALTPDDLRAFHAENYTPKGAVLSIVGKFDPAEMLKLVEAKFGVWTGNEPRTMPTAKFVAPTSASRLNVNIDGKDNLSIYVGVPTEVNASHPDYLALFIANKAVGGDTLTSRLGKEIREKRGMTYGVTSSLHDFGYGGATWAVDMTTNGAKVPAAITLINAVVADFVANGITQAELDNEKAGVINALAMRLDSPLDIASRLLSYEMGGLGGGSWIDTYAQRVNALTKEQVDAVIRKYFGLGAAVTVVAGTLPSGMAS